MKYKERKCRNIEAPRMLAVAQMTSHPKNDD